MLPLPEPGADGTLYRLLADNMSDGTLRAFGILTALFQGDREYSPTLIGIEEPETALHPAAAGALRGALQRTSKKNQVIVTTLFRESRMPSAFEELLSTH